MKKSFVLGCLTAAALGSGTSAAFADYTLNILHFNDFHSREEQIDKYDSTCNAETVAKNACFGGAARMKTEIDMRRQALQGQNVILLDAGDNFQGSLFYTYYKGAAEAEILNDLNVDAMTVGNHEFDNGESALAPFLDKVHFPVLGANVKTDAQSKLGDRIKPSTILTVGGQKIGIVGAVTEETATLSSPGPHVQITNDVAAITTEVQKLKAEGVNKIIVLSHVGYQRDLNAVAKIPDVDVVVGGHSHTLLSNTDSKAAGPYPTMVDNPGGYKVPVVTARAFSKYLGDIAVTFDDNGVVKAAKGDPILLDASVKPDPQMQARVEELAKPLEALRNKVIGSATAPIEGSREICRTQECSMGNLVADAILDKTKSQGTQFAIINGGGLRASIGAGDVTVGEVLTVLPFQNTVATFKLTGADVKEALENGVSEVADGAGRFPQVSGLKFTFDRSKPVGQRIVSLQVEDGGKFQPIDPKATYGVASNNFMRSGGDGYSVFATKAKDAYDFGDDMEQVVADYIAAHSPYKPYIDGRITPVVAAATPEQPAATKPAETQIVPAGQKPAPAETAQSNSTQTTATEAPATAAPPADTSASKPAASDNAASGSGAPKPASSAQPASPVSPATETPTLRANPSSQPSETGQAPASDSGAASPATRNGPANSDTTSAAPLVTPPAEDKAQAAQPDASAPAGANKPAPAPAAPEQAAPSAPQATNDGKPAPSENPAPATPAPAPDNNPPSTPETSGQPATEQTKPLQTPVTSETKTPAAAMPAETEDSGSRTHVIVKGDTLWDLAGKYYGNPNLWRRIDRANDKQRVRHLQVGDKLTIPAK